MRLPSSVLFLTIPTFKDSLAEFFARVVANNAIIMVIQLGGAEVIFGI